MPWVSEVPVLMKGWFVLEEKVEHYRYLIEQGLDCGTP